MLGWYILVIFCSTPPLPPVIICHHSSSFGLPPLPLGWWRHLWTAPYWQPPQLFKLYISMFQWAEASSWHGITIFPKQPATRIKSIVSKRQTHPHTKHCPVGNKGLPDKKLAGPRCVSISPRIFGPPPLFLILVLRNGESSFIFLLELDFGAPTPITLSNDIKLLCHLMLEKFTSRNLTYYLYLLCTTNIN